MAHTGIYATKAECDAAAGKNVDATGWSETNINNWCLQAEGVLHTVCRVVFATTTAGYTAMPTGGKAILADFEANYVALQGIKYHMNGFTTRTEAEDMINICRDNCLRDLSLLRDKKNQDFIIAGA